LQQSINRQKCPENNFWRLNDGFIINQGRPVNAVVEIEETNQLIPHVTECQKAPKVSLKES
jgi:hypothetical protein